MEARMNPTHEARRVSSPLRTIQPAWVRITHWLNALAAILMMLSGWRIYDASPVFKGFVIPPGITHKFFPLSPRAILHDLTEALKGHLSHADPSKYNAVQKFAYLFVMLDIT